MMSKKGLLKFVKYTLIFSNAFGFILSIFLGLFGIAYPDKHFPLSYKGREMALCSLFCMLFTTIGYCGAQNHRRILLIIYGATNVIIVIIVVILWFLFRENSILGNKEISNMFITTLAITIAVMFLFAFILAFHIKTFKDDTQDSIVSQSHQLLQQTTAFLQQQQQHQQQQASLLAAAAGAAPSHHHHHQQQHPHHLAAGPNAGPPAMQMNIKHLEHPYGLGHAPAGPAGPGQLQLGGPGPGHMAPSIMAPPHARPAAHHSQLDDLGGPMAAGPAGFQLMMPPPPPPAAMHAHLKSSSSGASQQRAKKQHPPAGAMILTQAGAAPVGLMRNQSSPLPGGPQLASGSARSSQNKVAGQQLYSQSQKSLRGAHPQQQQQQQPPSPPPPPPPPLSLPAGPTKQPGMGPAHHHSARGGDRAMMGQPAGANQRMPSCPVQYCTFDCDRTV